jgi:hypothetical protein
MLFASQENLSGSEGAGTEEDTMFRVDPHKFLLEKSREGSPVRSMPGKENDVTISLRSLFDEPDFAFTKATDDRSAFVVKQEHKTYISAPQFQASLK